MSYIGNIPTTVAFLVDTFSGNGSTTAFTLSQAPATTSSILVSVSGVLQDPSTYSVSGVTLTFSGAPPSGTGNISVRFLGIPASSIATTAYRTTTEFTATAGQTTFSVPSYTVGYIDVYRNGALLGSADYTATSGTTVVLANAASSGDLVETISFFVSSVLNAIPAVANAVTDTYINTGAVTTTKIADANVTQAKLASGVAGTGPAFSAFLSSSQGSISTGTDTKVALNGEYFDTAGCFNNTGSTVTLNGISTPSYSFAPNVAGYYQLSARIRVDGSPTRQIVYLFKNGGYFQAGTDLSFTGPSGVFSNIVYANGTSDTFAIFVYVLGGSPTITATGGDNYFSGALVRAA